MSRRRLAAVVVALAAAGCNGILGIDAPTLVTGPADAAMTADGGPRDATPRDGPARDATTHDATTHDATTRDGAGRDGTTHDATSQDARSDARLDAPVDASTDQHASDARRDATPDPVVDGGRDAGVDGGHDAGVDAGPVFTGTCTCDGGGCAPVAIAVVGQGRVTGLAMGDGGLYFATNTGTSGEVGLAGYDHVTRHLLTDAGALLGLGTHGGNLYWLDTTQGTVETCAAHACTPSALVTSPSIIGADPVGANPPLSTSGFAVLWADPTGTHVCPFAGGCSDPPTLAGSQIRQGSVFFAATDTSAYWTVAEGGIAECAASGCGVSADASAILAIDGGGPPPLELVVANSQAYWVEGTPAEIWSCALKRCTETARPLVVVDGGVSVASLAVDGTGVYWLDAVRSEILRASLDGGVPTRLATDASVPNSVPVALGATCVFWASSPARDGTHTILAVAKQ